MTRYALALTAIAAALVLNATTTARAHTPEDVYDDCVEAIASAVHRCQARNRTSAADGSQLITRLLNAGQTQRARLVAHRYRRKINADSEECVDYVNHLCRRCVTALLEFGAEELARDLVGVCDRAVHAIRKSQRAALAAINNALGG
ncbi:MAG: hypothetical protein CMJ48_00665 [Planctomycetaceae bacterium]|nr:hypothetical protein [Planctomycetaceae bacterium]